MEGVQREIPEAIISLLEDFPPDMHIILQELSEDWNCLRYREHLLFTDKTNIYHTYFSVARYLSGMQKTAKQGAVTEGTIEEDAEQSLTSD